MSENEIRGETANGDGSYFRQLIFYKILLADSYLYRDKEIIPALIFVKPSDKGDCVVVSLPITGNDTERVRNEIQKLIDSVWSGRIMTDRCDDLKCEFCALRTMMG